MENPAAKRTRRSTGCFMIRAHAALLKNYGAKAEAMNDLVAEIEGVFDENPKDGVAAANAQFRCQANQTTE